MGSRCHYPFWDKGSVRAHLLSTHRCRTAQDVLCAFGSHGWFSSNCSFLSSGGVPGAEYEMAIRHRRYNHEGMLDSRGESTVAIHAVSSGESLVRFAALPASASESVRAPLQSCRNRELPTLHGLQALRWETRSG